MNKSSDRYAMVRANLTSPSFNGRRLDVRAIPTGLHHSAQGWPRQRTTLGKRSKIISNPNGVESSRRRLMQPLQGCCRSLRRPRVARSSQPWAGRFESLQDSPRAARFKNLEHRTSNAEHRMKCARTRALRRSMLDVRCSMFPNFRHA